MSIAGLSQQTGKRRWLKIGFDDEMPVSLCDKEDTKEVVINGKWFHLEADYDVCGVKSVHLTECGDPDKTEMLEAYDLYPGT